ncbi:Hypothetical predicted protein [Lecanosticta acicola]|uniref:Arrestin-like N-terminal domain-containing protein n=1 Tax=Lecanosticta acicola TaxID=111012 RepID=A0AAI8Z6F3_9PEZI|nr:Hypothetical predicted protein [Lecanosticta acicola]
MVQWSALSTSLQATVILDQPGNVAFTSLDQISGRAMVRCAKAVDVSNVVVKLEGESRTRLMSPPGADGQRPKPQVEYHKILYKVQMVFPPPDVASRSTASAKYTIPQGQHEYPFSFKLPFNNNCSTNNKSQPPMLGLDPVRPAEKHVKKTLPPTLSGFPGEAEIRYYVKVTVNRQSFFKENPRAYTPFNFFPIEPPRPSPTGSEVYARQRHAFSAFPHNGDVKDKMKGLFSKKSSASSSPIPPTTAPSISVDARLQEPAILTCNSDIPLRLIVKKINEHDELLYLDSLQISLIGHTKVRAHEVSRTETQSWIITSRSNMNIPIDPINTDTVLPDHMWRGLSLPNTVAPTFETCNIARSYQLDIRIGFSYSGGGLSKVRMQQNARIPQKVTLPLRLDTLVYSGIAPPAEVISRMADARSNVRRTNTNAMAEKLQAEGRRDSDFGRNQIPPTPIDAGEGPSWPARPGVPLEGIPEYMDAPPSYEDAIASDIPPVAAASRPAYNPPPHQEDPLLGDEKKGLH